MKKVGILGAGQLGAYLCRAAKDLGLHTTVLADSDKDVAASIADQALVGTVDSTLTNKALLDQMLESCDVITYEKEDIPVAVLQYLDAADKAGQVRIAPAVDTLLLLQNKASQKAWYERHDFPTAPFIVPPENLSFTEIAARLGTPFVIKTQRGGYDGLGVKVITNQEELAAFKGVPVIAEKLIDGKRELAVMVARNSAGESVAYPCFEMFFNAKGNVLRHVVSPAAVEQAIADQATALGTAVVEKLQGVGIFAVELFLQDGALLINEISPRVHNSGHLTIEAQPTSQFEQHLRAISDLPLGEVSAQSAGAMINLLCEPEIEAACRVGRSIVPVGDDSVVHWYGKEELRPLRKMGHISSTGENPAAALAAAEACWQELAAFKQQEVLEENSHG